MEGLCKSFPFFTSVVLSKCGMLTKSIAEQGKCVDHNDCLWTYDLLSSPEQTCESWENYHSRAPWIHVHPLNEAGQGLRTSAENWYHLTSFLTQQALDGRKSNKKSLQEGRCYPLCDYSATGVNQRELASIAAMSIVASVSSSCKGN